MKSIFHGIGKLLGFTIVLPYLNLLTVLFEVFTGDFDAGFLTGDFGDFVFGLSSVAL